MFRLDNKLALITGASGGIGKAIAYAFVKQGAKVILSGTRENVLKEIQIELGGEAHALVHCTDLKNIEAVKGLVSEVEKLAGASIDILVNNAGITRDMLAIRMKETDWNDVIGMNLSVPFLLSQSALKGMLRRRSGRIINIASIVGSTGNAGQANYSAAKGGLIAMGKSLALEAASRGVTVNTIAPGFIQTAMTDQLSDEQKSKLSEKIPCNRMGKVEDIAAAAVYLASDEAEWVTGSTLHVNGGMLMA